MPFGIGLVVLLMQFAFAAHVFRTGRSLLWLLPIIFLPVLGCITYAIFALLPDTMGSAGARRFADDVANMADPGRAYREKKREVEMVGSVRFEKGAGRGMHQARPLSGRRRSL